MTIGDGGITWTATFTPTADIEDATNVITLATRAYTDAGGQCRDGTTTSRQLHGRHAASDGDDRGVRTALKVGETSSVTITFSEAVTGFTNADLTVANGTLSSVTTGDGGITWTATFTPTANIEDATNVITLANTGVHGRGGQCRDRHDDVGQLRGRHAASDGDDRGVRIRR